MRKIWLMLTLIMSLNISTAKEVDLQYFKKTLPHVAITSVAPSPIEGLHEVSIAESPYPIYISEDGQYILEGQMIDLIKGKNLTEERSYAANKALIDAVDPKEMIIYKSPTEKNVVTVFTDTDCAYCQILHKELHQYLDEGITIQYLAFPRMGINSKGYNEMVSIWCSEDPVLAMNDMILKKKIQENKCNTHSIAKQYELGKKLGISGTPAIILDDGSIISGYAPAKELRKILDVKK